MAPELFEIGPFLLRSYGLMMAVGFGVGAWWLVRRGRARGLPPSRLIDLSIAMVVAGLLGARLLYAITHWSEFAGAWWRIFWPVQEGGTVGMHGFVYYGGIIVAVPTTILLVRRWRIKPLKVLDAAAPPLALGTAIGRVGCFLNGCCFGVPTEGMFGVVFPPESLAGSTFVGIPIHPTQIYAVFDNLVIVAILLWIERRWAKFDGIVIGAYLVLTGLTRAYEDLFRYYESGMQLLATGGVVITVNHLISLALAAGGILLIMWTRSRASDSPD